MYFYVMVLILNNKYKGLYKHICLHPLLSWNPAGNIPLRDIETSSSRPGSGGF